MLSRVGLIAILVAVAVCLMAPVAAQDEPEVHTVSLVSVGELSSMSTVEYSNDAGSNSNEAMSTEQVGPIRARKVTPTQHRLQRALQLPTNAAGRPVFPTTVPLGRLTYAAPSVDQLLASDPSLPLQLQNANKKLAVYSQSLAGKRVTQAESDEELRMQRSVIWLEAAVKLQSSPHHQQALLLRAQIENKKKAIATLDEKINKPQQFTANQIQQWREFKLQHGEAILALNRQLSALTLTAPKLPKA